MQALCDSAAISILVFLLAACTGETKTGTKDQARKPQIFQEQERAIEKAKGVEQTIQDASAQQRRLVDSQD